ncbi:hypothetical protein EPA93_32610 [Ktedonosporobacter rubrisoli]|uniref:XRE family transcriptional regulator n=1 Tax=Ktedonosporobacter rubrisoli TaxID=2509675 RepID=A0A4V0YZP7_KTERU|nr:hypothetical protein [Ktedonosporobacter rubrisoli]QBD80461.1 hypothetical protein EPA93_32610 [Ktedonosporobacter rubrisoli]
MELDISQQETLPLPLNDTFRAYMERHHLTWVAIARLSGVRVITVWRIWSDLPVFAADAQRVRVAVESLTGYAYLGPLLTYEFLRERMREKHERPIRT